MREGLRREDGNSKTVLQADAQELAMFAETCLNLFKLALCGCGGELRGGVEAIKIPSEQHFS